MGTKRSVWDRQWGWPTIIRQLPETLVCWAVGVGAGLLAATAVPAWRAAGLGALAAFVWALGVRLARLAAFLWRHAHWYGWPHELPAMVVSSFPIGASAYSIVVLIADGTSPAHAAVWGGAWGALLMLMAFGHARRVRRRAERLAGAARE